MCGGEGDGSERGEELKSERRAPAVPLASKENSLELEEEKAAVSFGFESEDFQQVRKGTGHDTAVCRSQAQGTRAADAGWEGA